ncbi:MAG: SPOR domain-containing protein [Candidatus Omnitrophica bacterium]|nr:SPOR domain-containing protein [Candidatus Omnitrophota bacterium]
MPNMNITRMGQSQFELFPKPAKISQDAFKPSRLTKDLTLSLENSIVLCIIFLMVLVLFFSFGVERGKKIALLAAVNEEGNVAQAAEEHVIQQPADVKEKVKEGQRVILPVNLPEVIREEKEPGIKPPIEKTQEQEKLFTIQVASFKLEKSAKREADRLRGVGHEDTFVVPKGNYSIVCVGKFGQMDEAKRFSSKLKKRYNDCLVRRL